MPELPEVETIRKGLESRIVGLFISSIEVRVDKLFQGDPDQLRGSLIEGVKRQGKLLIILLDQDLVLTIHLKMTGQLIWQAAVQLTNSTSEPEQVVGGHPQEAYLQPLPHKHTHIIFSLSDGSKLYFNDLRKFGKVTLLNKAELQNNNFLRKLGPEPLSANFNFDYLISRLRQKKRQMIKSFLLDQENIAGLGNIYADESLFRAAILPDRLAGSLTQGEVRNLFEAIQETIELAILHGGSTARDYLNAVGEKGTFLQIANVYQRTGQVCNRCGGKVERKKIGGRSSHYCPNCQR
jgi:formamidopyrimidine-DNA glycosylase